MSSSPKEYLPLIQKIKDKLKDDSVFKEMCAKYDFDPNDIDLIPVKIDDIEVSAKTDQGVITLNSKYIDDIQYLTELLVHENWHYLSQADHPTQSADDGDYLSNKQEQEAFQFQTKFIDENEGEKEAEDYVEQVLDHHDETGKEREKKKDILMKKVQFFNQRTFRKV